MSDSGANTTTSSGGNVPVKNPQQGTTPVPPAKKIPSKKVGAPPKKK